MRGFSLIEMMIAMAISSFIVLAALTMHIDGVKQQKKTENQSSLSQDSILILDYLNQELMAAGGGSLRAWMGIWVENDCAARSVFPNCANSDRMTTFSLAQPTQECTITAQNNPFVMQGAFTSPGVCCFQSATPGDLPFLGHSVALALNGNYVTRFVTAVNPLLCQMTLTGGQASGGDFPGAVVNWTTGSASLINIKTFYWDSTAFTLMQFIDANNNNAVDTGELVVLADQIYDLQFALGYDFSSADGNITEAADGIGDEWLYNAPTAVENYGVGFFVPPLTRSQLKLVQYGVVLGVLDNSGGTVGANQQVLNGPLRTRTGWTMQSATSRLAPRNSFIFQ